MKKKEILRLNKEKVNEIASIFGIREEDVPRLVSLLSDVISDKVKPEVSKFVGRRTFLAGLAGVGVAALGLGSASGRTVITDKNVDVNNEWFLTKPEPYNCIVIKDGNKVYAYDWKGKEIINGKAGVSSSSPGSDTEVVLESLKYLQGIGGGVLSSTGDLYIKDINITNSNFVSNFNNDRIIINFDTLYLIGRVKIFDSINTKIFVRKSILLNSNAGFTFTTVNHFQAFLDVDITINCNNIDNVNPVIFDGGTGDGNVGARSTFKLKIDGIGNTNTDSSKAISIINDAKLYGSSLDCTLFLPYDNNVGIYIDSNIKSTVFKIKGEGSPNAYFVELGENYLGSNPPCVFIFQSAYCNLVKNPYDRVFASNITPRKNYGTVPLGYNDTYGSKFEIVPYLQFAVFPQVLGVTLSGTFGTGETITVKYEIVSQDGDTRYIERSYSTTGDYFLTEADKFALFGWKPIKTVNIYAKTNLASSSVSVEGKTIFIIVSPYS